MAVFLPGSASASCGDYVHIAPAGLITDANLKAHENEPASPVPAPCGCHGPQCGNAPLPLVPPASAPSHAGQNEAIVDPGLRCDLALNGVVIRTEGASFSIELVVCIFHPPRA
jgi:hypothetical protein